MKIIKSEFEDLFILEPNVFDDDRGYFFESYNLKVFSDNGLVNRFVQDNQSKSKNGVLRGLHYQNAPYSQSKLIRVLNGSILDIALDLRKEKPTFGKFFSLQLSSESKRQLFVPKGFAHGFLVLSDFAEILYKTDEFYNRDSERGINFFDPALDFRSVLGQGNFLLSEKDNNLPYLADAKFNF